MVTLSHYTISFAITCLFIICNLVGRIPQKNFKRFCERGLVTHARVCLCCSVVLNQCQVQHLPAVLFQCFSDVIHPDSVTMETYKPALSCFSTRVKVTVFIVTWFVYYSLNIHPFMVIKYVVKTTTMIFHSFFPLAGNKCKYGNTEEINKS